jgi:hypothetical protein
VAEIVCNCGHVSPTMPTARGEHLRTCPAFLYNVILKMQAANEEARLQVAGEQAPPPVKVKANVPLAVLSAEAVTLAAIRALLEGDGSPDEHPTEGEGDSRRWKRSAGVLAHAPARARSDVDAVLDAAAAELKAHGDEAPGNTQRWFWTSCSARWLTETPNRDRIRERLHGD